MKRRLLLLPLFLLPSLAWADTATTTVLQQAYAQARSLQPQLSPQESAQLQQDLQQMTADQVNPALFGVDHAIFEARVQGLRAAHAPSSAQEKERLQRQLNSLNQRYQSLQAEYAQLRQQLANRTMESARSSRLQQEIQQQKQTLQQEEQSLAKLQPKSSAAPATSPTARAPQAAPVPQQMQALASYGTLRQGKYGTELDLPVASLFSGDRELSANGRQRLRSIAGALKGVSAPQILVRVSSQPGGINLATQRAEAIVQGLRQAGVPEQRLALAANAGVANGMAQILLPSGS
jgi:type IV pilus biogenesis protein CpaD/CtpE